MKFQKFWQKERDSIIRLLNDPIWHLELILVNFQSTPSLKNSTKICTKIFRQEDNNSNRRENIRAYAMNSFLKITHTLIAMERANRSLKPSNSRSREKSWKCRSGQQQRRNQRNLLVPSPATLRYSSSRVISRGLESKRREFAAILLPRDEWLHDGFSRIARETFELTECRSVGLRQWKSFMEPRNEHKEEGAPPGLREEEGEEYI